MKRVLVSDYLDDPKAVIDCARNGERVVLVNEHGETRMTFGGAPIGELELPPEETESHPFWRTLERHDRQIGELIQGLADETESRRQGERRTLRAIAELSLSLTTAGAHR